MSKTSEASRTSSIESSPQRSTLTKRKPFEGEAARYSPARAAADVAGPSRAAAVPVARESSTDDPQSQSSGDASSGPGPTSSSGYGGSRPQSPNQQVYYQPWNAQPANYQPMYPVGQAGGMQIQDPEQERRRLCCWRCDANFKFGLVQIACIIFAAGILTGLVSGIFLNHF